MADEQVGNNSYLTMTPGSAVAGQLQDILARKRLEARQSMLDQIAGQKMDLDRRNTESEMRYREENAAGLREQREGMAQERKAKADSMFLTRLGDNPRNLDPQTAAQLKTIDPSRLEAVPGGSTLPSTKVGPSGVSPDPSQPDPQVPQTLRYLGSPAYEKQHETQQKLEGLAKDPNFTNLPPEKQLLQLSQIFPGTDPTAIFERLLTAKTQQTPGRFIVYDEALGKRKDMGPLGPNDKTAMVPRPPRDPQDHGTFLDRPVIGADGKPDPTKVYVMKNGSISIQTVPGGGTLGAKPTTGGAKPVITPAEAIKYSQLRGKATDEPNGMLFSGKKAKEADKVAFSQLEKDIYGRFPTDVATAVKDAIEAESKTGASNEDIVKKAIAQGVVLPGEEQMFYSLLQTVR